VPAAQVTCGSTIKLAHSASGARLHSHGVAYSRGSQQQSVTGYPTSDDAQSYWIVHPAVVRVLVVGAGRRGVVWTHSCRCLQPHSS
jgi:dolichyl-phosphate-mannose--protein O-mannosyl transferase